MLAGRAQGWDAHREGESWTDGSQGVVPGRVEPDMALGLTERFRMCTLPLSELALES